MTRTPQEIGRGSRIKGKVQERAVVHKANDCWLAGTGIEARRTVQVGRGRDAADMPDVGIYVNLKTIADDKLHEVMCVAVEVKVRNGLRCGQKWLDAACEQAKAAAGGRPWCVIWRATGERQWKMTYNDSLGRVTRDTDDSIKAAILSLAGME